jgi:16S rRNA (cytidine1402-2'-O)-methyltransferase
VTRLMSAANPPADPSFESAGGSLESPSSLSATPGCLFVVSTPIGNPDDISLRALHVLRTAAVIAVEDIRVTRKLLHHFQIDTPLVSYRPRSQKDDTQPLLDRITAGQDIALVCDAGTPVLADPGLALIGAAQAQGIRIVPIPGASALLAALVASGLVSGRFAFDGFPPRARTDRQQFFIGLKEEKRAIILYESRRYLRDTLQSLLPIFGPLRPVALARNLTLETESIFYGTLRDACTISQSSLPGGEYVLVIGK